MKGYQRPLALLLALSLVFVLSACAQSGGESTETKPESVGTVYTASLQDTGGSELPKDQSFYGTWVLSDGFYGSIYTAVGQTEGGIDERGEPVMEEVYEERLWHMTPDGTLRELEGYRGFHGENTHPDAEGWTGLSTVTAGAEGQIIALVQVDSYWSEAGEDVEPYSDEWFAGYQSRHDYYLRVFDTASGEELENWRLDTAALPVSEYSDGQAYVYDMFSLGDGRLLMQSDAALAVYDLAARRFDGVLETGDSFWINNVSVQSDGTVLVSYNPAAQEGGSSKLSTLNVDTMTFDQELPFDGYLYNSASGTGDYLFFYRDGNSIYGYRRDTRNSEKLFNYLNLDLSPDGVGTLLPQEDGSFLAVYNEYEVLPVHTLSTYDGKQSAGSTSTKLLTIRPVPASEVREKQHLTLATQGLDWMTQQAVLRFNRSREDVHIDVADYSEYNNEKSGWTAGATKLKTEILSGHMPDILDLEGMPARQLAARGLLLDQGALLDADGELSRGEYLPNVLDAMTEGEVLFAIPASFAVQTLVGARRVVGDTPGWTYTELMAALRAMPEGCTVLSESTDRAEVLRVMLGLDMDRFVDWSRGEVHFDSPEFLEVLQFTRDFPEEFDWANYEYTEESGDEYRISHGLQMLASCQLYSFENVLYYQQLFGGSEDAFTLIGYPCTEGNGAVMSVLQTYGISKDCKNTEAAWDFLRGFLTGDYQGSGLLTGFPVSRAALEEKARAATEPQYFTDMDGNALLDENGEKQRMAISSYWDGERYREIYACSESQVRSVLDVLMNTTCMMDSNDAVYDIVTEQAQAFYAGQKSAEEVARLIQSKANIYVNEQR